MNKSHVPARNTNEGRVNTLENPMNVVPVASPLKVSKTFEYAVPPMSLIVIRRKAKLCNEKCGGMVDFDSLHIDDYPAQEIFRWSLLVHSDMTSDTKLHLRN